MFLKIPSTESSESCQPQRISDQQIVLVCNVGRQSDFLHIKARGAPWGPSSKFYMLHPISEFACQRIVYWVRRMHLKQTSMCKEHYDQYLSQRGIALPCLPCKNDKITTPLACLRHAARVSQTGMEAQAAWGEPPFQFG